MNTVKDLHRDAVAAILKSAHTGRGYDRHHTRELEYVAANHPAASAALLAEVERRAAVIRARARGEGQ